MKKGRRSSVVTILLLFCGALRADASPRQGVLEIAKLIEATYFDPVRAKEIAEKLREESKRGAFDQQRDPNDLAATLTEELRTVDGHFHVSWDPKYQPPQPEDPAAQNAYERSAARANYGFRKIGRLSGNVGYIDISEVADIDFSNPADKARATADAALGLVRGADAVIIDLRDNGGGAPTMVGYLVSAFVKDNADVYNTFYSREGTESERPATAFANPMLDVPLFVLTNTRTGSAAEAIAFTLQSCGRAKVVGERSAGAANPGEPFHTQRGYTIFISTGSPKNPINHRNWEGTGVQPDVDVPAQNALRRAHALALQSSLSRLSEGIARTETQLTLEGLNANEHPSLVNRPLDYVGAFGVYTVSSEGGTLVLKRNGGSATTLIPIANDTFAPESDLTRRVRFDRGNNQMTALEVVASDGETRRLLRTPSSGP